MRYLCVIMILILIVFNSTIIHNKDDFFSLVNDVCDNAEMVDNNDFKVVKIDGLNYLNILDKMHVQIIRKFVIDDRLIIEGYTNQLNDYIVVNNIKTNLQISVSDNICLVGYPLIKNSF